MPKSIAGNDNAEAKVVIRPKGKLHMDDFKGYQFFFPLVIAKHGWIDIVGEYNESRGVEFGFRVSFRPAFDGPIFCKRLSEAVQILNDGQELLAQAS